MATFQSTTGSGSATPGDEGGVGGVGGGACGRPGEDHAVSARRHHSPIAVAPADLMAPGFQDFGTSIDMPICLKYRYCVLLFDSCIYGVNSRISDFDAWSSLSALKSVDPHPFFLYPMREPQVIATERCVHFTTSSGSKSACFNFFITS